jgi:hypothetical protein
MAVQAKIREMRDQFRVRQAGKVQACALIEIQAPPGERWQTDGGRDQQYQHQGPKPG